jgi:hypothetical protein
MTGLDSDLDPDDLALVASDHRTANDVYHLPDPDDPRRTRYGDCGQPDGEWDTIPREVAERERRLCQLCDPDAETHGPRKPQRRSLRRAIAAGDVEVDG